MIDLTKILKSKSFRLFWLVVALRSNNACLLFTNSHPFKQKIDKINTWTKKTILPNSCIALNRRSIFLQIVFDLDRLFDIFWYMSILYVNIIVYTCNSFLHHQPVLSLRVWTHKICACAFFKDLLIFHQTLSIMFTAWIKNKQLGTCLYLVFIH